MRLSLSQSLYSNHWRSVFVYLTQVVKGTPQLTVSRLKKREMCVLKGKWHSFNLLHPIFSLQVTERMKLVDVLGAKQFSDSERIITQVRS